MKRRFTFILPVLMVLGFALIGCANNVAFDDISDIKKGDPAHEHDFVLVVNATCATPSTEKCSCGIETHNVEAFGHDFGDNLEKCNRCDVANPDYVAPAPAHEHNYERLSVICPNAKEENKNGLCDNGTSCPICKVTLLYTRSLKVAKSEVENRNKNENEIVIYKDENGELYYHIKGMTCTRNEGECRRLDCGGFISVDGKVINGSETYDLTYGNLVNILRDVSYYKIKQ